MGKRPCFLIIHPSVPFSAIRGCHVTSTSLLCQFRSYYYPWCLREEHTHYNSTVCLGFYVPSQRQWNMEEYLSTSWFRWPQIMPHDEEAPKPSAPHPSDLSSCGCLLLLLRITDVSLFGQVVHKNSVRSGVSHISKITCFNPFGMRIHVKKSVLSPAPMLQCIGASLDSRRIPACLVQGWFYKRQLY